MPTAAAATTTTTTPTTTTEAEVVVIVPTDDNDDRWHIGDDSVKDTDGEWACLKKRVTWKLNFGLGYNG